MEILLGQWFELAVVFIRKLLPLGLTVEQVKDLIQNKEHPFWVAFNEATKLLVPKPVSDSGIVQDIESRGAAARKEIEKQFALWRKIYSEEGIELPSDEELFKLLPKRQPGFGWMVITPKGMTISLAWAMCKKRFACWNPNRDLESEMRETERGETKDISIVWFRDRVEADEEMKNLSANMLDEPARGLVGRGITILRRILLEVFYFTMSSGNHLDIKNWTLCNGSRSSEGYVPCADWSDDRFDVGWDDPGNRYPRLRSRIAVG